MSNKKQNKIKKAQQKICFWLRLCIIANLCLLGFMAVAIPLAQDAISATPTLSYKQDLKRLNKLQTQAKQSIYQQQQQLEQLIVRAKSQKPSDVLILLSMQLIKQEADLQDFIYYSRKSTNDIAKLLDSQEWAYNKSLEFNPFITSSRKRQLMLRQLAKQLKQAASQRTSS